MLAGLQLHSPQLSLGEAATLPCPRQQGRLQQHGLRSSVHKLCKVVCEQLLG